MTPLISLTCKAKSGNVCDVHFFVPTRGEYPVNVQWESYPPSAEDVAESEAFVCLFLREAGMNCVEARSVVDNTITTEELCRRLSSAGVN